MRRVSETARPTSTRKWGTGRRARVITLQEHLVGRVRSWMLILLGAVGLVLLIACANVANLMLVAPRCADGRLVSARRSAPAAGGWSADCWSKGSSLSLAGAALGCAARRCRCPDPPRVAAGRATAGRRNRHRPVASCFATIAAAVVTGIFFGIVPALQSVATGSHACAEGRRPIRDRGRPGAAAAQRPGRRRSRAGGHAPCRRGALHRQLREPDARRSRARLSQRARAQRQPAPHARREIRRRATQRATRSTSGRCSRLFGRVPGVEMVATVSGGTAADGQLEPHQRHAARPRRVEGRRRRIDRRTVSPNYLQTLRIPPAQRAVPTDDDATTLAPGDGHQRGGARRLLARQDPLGQRIIVRRQEEDASLSASSATSAISDPRRPPRQECYIPFAQDETTVPR